MPPFQCLGSMGSLSPASSLLGACFGIFSPLRHMPPPIHGGYGITEPCIPFPSGGDTLGFGPPHILGVYGFTLSRGVHWDLGFLTYMCHPFLLAEAEKEDAGGTQHQDAEHEAAPSRERGPHHRECCPREGEAGLGGWGGTPHNGVPPASPHPTVLQEESCQAKRSPSSPQGGPKKRSAFGDLTNVSAA